jgi:DNA excision repair protein ERCC-3
LYTKPLIVHPDSRNIYVIENLDEKGEVSQQLTEYADPIQTPEQVHTFKLTPYALWTAKAKGIEAEEVILFLEEHSQNYLPDSFKQAIKKEMNHFGVLEFLLEDEVLKLTSKVPEIIGYIKSIAQVQSKIIREDHNSLSFRARYRKEIKKLLFEKNLFIKDPVYQFGDQLDILVLDKSLLDYQKDAVDSYLSYNQEAGGGGTIILPPNSGDTAVGLKIIETLKTSTLIIVEDKYKMDKWKQVISENTDLPEQNISIFEHKNREIKAITIGTYEVVCDYINELHGFGLVIYDDAHKLPTPKHENTVDIKSRNKLALAATLARSEDNGNLVFIFVGPKWFEILHRTLVYKGYQIPVTCVEVKVPLPSEEWTDYVRRDQSKKVNAATLNSNKYEALKVLLKKEVTKRMLIVSFHREVISKFNRLLKVDTLSSDLSEENRQRLIDLFNKGELNKLLTASKLIEHMSLLNVEVMIALSHQEGSEREEYLRLGKLLPKEEKKDSAILYSLVSLNTEEDRYYSKRRRRLINYGFRYKILTYEELLDWGEFIESY